MAQDIEKWLSSYRTVDQAANLLGVDSSTVLRWLNAGDLMGFQLGKQWRIADEDIQEFIRELKRRQEAKIWRQRAAREIRAELQRRKRREPGKQWVLVPCDYHLCDKDAVADKAAWPTTLAFCSSNCDDNYYRTDAPVPSRIVKAQAAAKAEHQATTAAHEFEDLPF